MIRLTRPPAPTELSEEVATTLTERYLVTRDPVWHTAYITGTLRTMSHDKCCYCECGLASGGSYMEVDHFFHKDRYPERVVEWTNLLPACKRCNTSKGTHDVGQLPIVDPTVQDPRDHLAMKLYRLRGSDTVGRATIDVLNLNDSERVVLARFRVGERVQREIEKLRDLVDGISTEIDATQSRRRTRVRSAVIQLLREGQAESEYGGTVATVLCHDEGWGELKATMNERGLWSEEMNDLESKAQEIALNIIP